MRPGCANDPDSLLQHLYSDLPSQVAAFLGPQLHLHIASRVLSARNMSSSLRMGDLIEPDTIASSSTGAVPPPLPAASDQNARTRELTAIPMRRPPKIPGPPDRPPLPALDTSGNSTVLRPEISHAENHDPHRLLKGGARAGYTDFADNAVAFRFASGSPTPIVEHTNAEVLQGRDPAPTPIAYNGDIHWPMTDKGKNKAEPPPLGEWYKKLERAEEIQHLKDSLYIQGLSRVEVISRWGIEGARWTKGELLPARFKQKQRAAQESPLYKDGVIDIGRIEGVPGHYVYVRPKRVKGTDGTMNESATYKALESGAVPVPNGDENEESDDGTGDVVRVPLGLQRLPHTAREMMELAERVQEAEGGRAQNMSHYPHAPLRLQFRPFAPKLTEGLQRHQPGWVPTGIDTNVSHPSNTDMTLSPANRLTDRIVRRIADYYTEIHMMEALPEVPLMPLHIDQGPVHNSRLTNAEKEAYKRATLRRKLFDLGRMCRSWWDGCSKGYKDVIIVGDKDAEVSHTSPDPSYKCMSSTDTQASLQKHMRLGSVKRASIHQPITTNVGGQRSPRPPRSHRSATRGRREDRAQPPHHPALVRSRGVSARLRDQAGKLCRPARTARGPPPRIRGILWRPSNRCRMP